MLRVRFFITWPALASWGGRAPSRCEDRRTRCPHRDVCDGHRGQTRDHSHGRSHGRAPHHRPYGRGDGCDHGLVVHAHTLLLLTY
jgi:hypothetical protein